MPIEAVVNAGVDSSIEERLRMTPEEFRRAGHRLIDWIADYRASVESRPVMAQDLARRDQGAGCPHRRPQNLNPSTRSSQTSTSIVMPGITTWQHPRFFGYFPSNALLSSVLGDYVSTGLGVIGLAWQSSPALTEVEEVAADWMRQMLGLSEAWSGVINDTASTSTLVALLCARERSSNYSLSRGGLQAEAQPLVVYASAQSHSSVEKAALLAGFGKQHLRIVPHDGLVRDAARVARRDDPGGPRRRPPALRRGGDHRHHDVDRARSAGSDRARSRRRAASGCTSMRPWPARR